MTTNTHPLKVFINHHDSPSNLPATGQHTDTKHKNIAVIDDDEEYGKLICELGKKVDLKIDYFDSLESMGSIGALRKYDAVVLDYYLEGMNGLEIAKYIDCFFPNIPAIVVSGSDLTVDDDKPRCIQHFMSKLEGPRKLLNKIQKIA